jgi:hypothetical protein
MVYFQTVPKEAHEVCLSERMDGKQRRACMHVQRMSTALCRERRALPDGQRRMSIEEESFYRKHFYPVCRPAQFQEERQPFADENKPT